MLQQKIGCKKNELCQSNVIGRMHTIRQRPTSDGKTTMNQSSSRRPVQSNLATDCTGSSFSSHSPLVESLPYTAQQPINLPRQGASSLENRVFELSFKHPLRSAALVELDRQILQDHYKAADELILQYLDYKYTAPKPIPFLQWYVRHQ